MDPAVLSSVKPPKIELARIYLNCGMISIRFSCGVKWDVLELNNVTETSSDVGWLKISMGVA